mgnify:CR=1 FL=1
MLHQQTLIQRRIFVIKTDENRLFDVGVGCQITPYAIDSDLGSGRRGITINARTYPRQSNGFITIRFCTFATLSSSVFQPPRVALVAPRHGPGGPGAARGQGRGVPRSGRAGQVQQPDYAVLRAKAQRAAIGAVSQCGNRASLPQ